MLVQARQTTRVFDRIVCGVDSSPESLEAARQADRLRASEGLLRLATVADVNVAVHAGFAATRVLGAARCSGTGRTSRGGRRRPSEQHAPPCRRPRSRPARRAAAVGCDARLGRAARTPPDARDAARRDVDGAAPRGSVLGPARAQAAIWSTSQPASSAGSTARISHLPPQKWRRPSPSDSASSWSSLRRQAGSRSISTGSAASARTSSTISAGRSRRWSIFRTRRTCWWSAAVAFMGRQRSEA